MIYARVSTQDQDCDRQERDLIDYAERAGYEVVEVFKETLSGIRKARGKQPIERAKAMALAQRREIDAVLVTEMTRWGRSTQDLMDTLGQLASWDVSLYVIYNKECAGSFIREFSPPSTRGRGSRCSTTYASHPRSSKRTDAPLTTT